MITVWRGDFVYKYDGKIGTLEDTIKKCMYFPNEEETKLCNKSNHEIDNLIWLVQFAEALEV